jgi:hypothetical protein
MELIPPEALFELAKVLDLGAKKYGRNNWRNGFQWSRLYGATQRHLNHWFAGEDNDPEANISHLAHAMCNLVFLLTFIKTHPELDDRKFTKRELIPGVDYPDGTSALERMGKFPKGVLDPPVFNSRPLLAPEDY